MLEKPNLDDDAIIAKLHEHYALRVTALTFLPIGYDVGSYVYRVETGDGTAYFLKARRAPMYTPSVVLPHYLNDHGMPQVVAPLPTSANALRVPFGAFNLILYPFIEARTGMDGGLTDSQWRALGHALKKLHTINLSAEVAALMTHEQFEKPYWVEMMQALQAKVMGDEEHDAIGEALVAFWKEHTVQINKLMARTLALGRMLHTEPRPFVLCHSDIHTANVLVEPGGALHIVDWDQPIFAPKERDLMFFGAGLGTLTGDAEDARHFYEGYGTTAIDRIAYAYYRYAWVMQDWAEYGASVLLRPALGQITRRDALRSFVRMFDAGDVVDVAYRSDTDNSLILTNHYVGEPPA